MHVEDIVQVTSNFVDKKVNILFELHNELFCLEFHLN